MAAKQPVATLVVLEHLPAGTTRALHVVYVPKAEDMDARAQRAEALRTKFAAETTNTVTVAAHLTKAA